MPTIVTLAVIVPDSGGASVCGAESVIVQVTRTLKPFHLLIFTDVDVLCMIIDIG